MYQATMATISAEQTRDMQEQAAAWRRTRETSGGARLRPARSFALMGRGGRSQARQKRQQGPAAA
jgi:hypothetical protein